MTKPTGLAKKFIQDFSSLDGNLGCFHNLAIINNVATNIGLHVSFWIIVFIFIFSDKYTGVKLLGHMVGFSFLEKLPYRYL